MAYFLQFLCNKLTINKIHTALRGTVKLIIYLFILSPLSKHETQTIIKFHRMMVTRPCSNSIMRGGRGVSFIILRWGQLGEISDGQVGWPELRVYCWHIVIQLHWVINVITILTQPWRSWHDKVSQYHGWLAGRPGRAGLVTQHGPI